MLSIRDGLPSVASLVLLEAHAQYLRASYVTGGK